MESPTTVSSSAPRAMGTLCTERHSFVADGDRRCSPSATRATMETPKDIIHASVSMLLLCGGAASVRSDVRPAATVGHDVAIRGLAGSAEVAAGGTSTAGEGGASCGAALSPIVPATCNSEAAAEGNASSRPCSSPKESNRLATSTTPCDSSARASWSKPPTTPTELACTGPKGKSLAMASTACTSPTAAAAADSDSIPEASESTPERFLVLFAVVSVVCISTWKKDGTAASDAESVRGCSRSLLSDIRVCGWFGVECRHKTERGGTARKTGADDKGVSTAPAQLIDKLRRRRRQPAG
mmetsp:Transcript_63366/g.163016  ORF Transcript_63366/g.163016 Transcript_63366/m.163016 type:complete len:298 (+) Transcript_63366:802-1695(+)